ncbi:MAG: transporter [Planctomycetota bacterium]
MNQATKGLLSLASLLVSPHLTAAQQDPWELSALLGPGITVGGRIDDGHSHGWSSARPDGHAPIGVMGDHVHAAGEWMVSVRYMQMHMDGMRDGTDELSSAEVLGEGFAVTPLEMDTTMLMLGGMYAPTDDLTLMLMVPYLSRSMDHVTGTGVNFETESEGLGDVRLSGLYNIYDEDGARVHLSLGLSVPTGSTDETDDTPAMADARLPYPMQLGTGTFDVLPGATYLAQSGDWSWGAQGTLRFHLGENDEGYTQGNRIEATGWLARSFGSLSVSARLNGMHWDDISGEDDELNPNMVPTADPANFGGERVDALVGANWYVTEGALAGNRLAFEIGTPILQDLNGPQLETDWVATIGWQYAP